MRVLYAHRPAFMPTTREGRRAGALALTCLGLNAGWQLLGAAGVAAAFAAGIAAGILALVAIVHERERAVSVYVSLVPLVLVTLFIALELASLA